MTAVFSTGPTAHRLPPHSASRRSAQAIRSRRIARLWEGPDAMAAGRIVFVGELDVASFPHIETLAHPGELTLSGRAAPLVVGSAPSSAPTALHRRAIAGAADVLRGSVRATDETRRLRAARRRGLQAVRHAGRPRRCSAPRRNAAATTCSPTTAPGTARAPGIRRRITGSSGRIARTSSCSCWTAASGSRRPTAASLGTGDALFVPRARRSGGKAASAWRSST